MKRAYHQLARKHHPDKGGDAEEFQRLGEAFAALGLTAAKVFLPADKVQDHGVRQGHKDFSGYKPSMGASQCQGQRFAAPRSPNSSTKVSEACKRANKVFHNKSMGKNQVTHSLVHELRIMSIISNI